jgi:hypothetical protein
MVRRVWIVSALLLLAGAASGEETHKLGVTAGFPMMAALAYQYSPMDYITLEVFVGTLIFNVTDGARLILAAGGNGFRPRVFAGFATVNQLYADYEDNPQGSTTYLWPGAGLEYNFPCGVKVFADIGYLQGGDRDKGLGYPPGAAFSGGLLFPL